MSQSQIECIEYLKKLFYNLPSGKYTDGIMSLIITFVQFFCDSNNNIFELDKLNSSYNCIVYNQINSDNKFFIKDFSIFYSVSKINRNELFRKIIKENNNKNIFIIKKERITKIQNSMDEIINHKQMIYDNNVVNKLACKYEHYNLKNIKKNKKMTNTIFTTESHIDIHNSKKIDEIKDHIAKYFSDSKITKEKITENNKCLLYTTYILANYMKEIDIYINILNLSIQNINDNLLKLDSDIIFNKSIPNKYKVTYEKKFIKHKIMDHYSGGILQYNDKNNVYLCNYIVLAEEIGKDRYHMFADKIKYNNEIDRNQIYNYLLKEQENTHKITNYINKK